MLEAQEKVKEEGRAHGCAVGPFYIGRWGVVLQEHVTQLQKRLPIGVEEFILQGESEGKSFVKGGAGGADMGGGVIDAFNSDLIGRCVGLYFPYSAGKAFTCDTARSNRRWWAWSGGRGCAIVEDGGEWKIGREGGVG